VAYALSDYMKIFDLGYPWRSLTTSTAGYPSDSFLFLLSSIKVNLKFENVFLAQHC